MGTRRVVVERHLSAEELRDAIKEADDCRVVRRLCFVSNLYRGDTLKQATHRVGASRAIGSEYRAQLFEMYGIDEWELLNGVPLLPVTSIDEGK